MNAIQALEVSRRRRLTGKELLTGVCALIAAAVLAGCTGNSTPGRFNVLQSIALAPGQTPALDTPLKFILGGVGYCSVNIDWGDGTGGGLLDRWLLVERPRNPAYGD